MDDNKKDHNTMKSWGHDLWAKNDGNKPATT